MCKALEDMVSRGEARGRAEGRAEGRTNGVLMSLKNLMKTTQMGLSQAMDALLIPQSERPMYEAMCSNA